MSQNSFVQITRYFVSAVMVFVASGSLQADPYNPLDIDAAFQAQTIELEVDDKTRSRQIPLRIYLPKASDRPSAVILFSHGLGGSNKGNAYMGNHWAGRGNVAVFVQHPGSDENVWKNGRLFQARAALKEAANLENYIARTQDVSAVLDQLKIWHELEGHALHGRIYLDQIGMSGHSFGAITTQAISGQVTGQGAFKTKQEPRIKAAMAFSPSPSNRGDAKQEFSKVKIPWMLMTGTHDNSPIGNTTVANRLEVFAALPPGNKYELVLEGGEHSAFTDHAVIGRKKIRNPNHHRVILALSTAFWDGYLQGNREALAWLKGDRPQKLMEKKDHWQLK